MENPQDDRQAPAGLTLCYTYHGPMVRMGPDYICPNGINPGQASCLNGSINANQLVRMVPNQIIQAVMHGPNLRMVQDLIQKEAQVMDSESQQGRVETMWDVQTAKTQN